MPSIAPTGLDDGRMRYEATTHLRLLRNGRILVQGISYSSYNSRCVASFRPIYPITWPRELEDTLLPCEAARYDEGALQFAFMPWILSWSARFGFDSYTVITGSNFRFQESINSDWCGMYTKHSPRSIGPGSLYSTPG